MKKALFLDRDGTLNYDINYLHEPERLRLIAGVAEALHKARALGFRFYMVTNQSGVGRGYFTLEDVVACNERLEELVGLEGKLFDGVCIAPEHPDEPVQYRKPSPRYLLERIEADGLDPRQCYMLGDRQSDWECGRLAGVNPVALRSGEIIDEACEAYIAEHKVLLFDALPDFVNWLEANHNASAR